jgi:hypothetical protein
MAMVRAIVTKINEDGTVNTTDRYSTYTTGIYSTKQELIDSHQAPWHWEGSLVRFQFFESHDTNNFLVDSKMQPFDTVFMKV